MSPEELPIDSRKYRIAFLGISALVVIAVIALARDVMLPFVLALLIAYVLLPLVLWVERWRIGRGLAIIIVYVAVLGGIGVSMQLMAPRVGLELITLRRELPATLSRVRDEWVPIVVRKMRALGLTSSQQPDKPTVERPALVVHPHPDGSFSLELGSGVAITPTRHGGYLVEAVRERDEPFDPNRVIADAIGRSFAYVQHNALELARIGRDIVAGISRVIFICGITLMLAAYLMMTHERILAFFTSLVRPSRRARFEMLLKRMDLGLSGVVRGQIIICLVNGVFSAIGFAMVELKYWPVLALLATVLSLIPIFGSILSSIPAVALGLTQSLGTAIFVLTWIIGIHQIEANFLNPKIMGDAAKIHPVLVIFSLLVGEHFFHTVGALLAVPCMSIAQSLFIHFRQIVQVTDPEFHDEPIGSMPPPPLTAPRAVEFPSSDI